MGVEHKSNQRFVCSRLTTRSIRPITTAIENSELATLAWNNIWIQTV